MELSDFLAYVKTGRALNTAEIHQFMNDMSNEARRITFELNNAYHTPEEVRWHLHRTDFMELIFSWIGYL